MRSGSCGLFLCLRYAQRDFVPIRRRHERAFFFCGSQTGKDVSKSDGVGADAEGGTPFFGDDFGEAGDAGFGEAVVGLAAGGVVSFGNPFGGCG